MVLPLQTLVNHIEAIIFCSPAPVTVEQMYQCLKEVLHDEICQEDIHRALEVLNKRYNHQGSAIELVHVADGYQFFTKPEYYPSVAALLRITSAKSLSQAALETLAIIAYRQPVTKAQIEQIRGVNCDYALQKLLEKELIEIVGRAQAPGKPLLYATSRAFMEYFLLNSVKDLPQPKDLPTEKDQQNS